MSNKLRKVWAFVMVLAFSRHMFVRPVLKMDQASWTAAHVAAFNYFGGAPRRSPAMISSQSATHSLQMYTPGPAISFFTCLGALPQKLHLTNSPPSANLAFAPPRSLPGLGSEPCCRVLDAERRSIEWPP